jgi:predicted nucleic acid-binding protein
MASIVIDANIGVALAVNLPYSHLAERQIGHWREAKESVLVPVLWQYEVVSALRKAVASSLLSGDEVMAALADLFKLGIHHVDPTLDQHRLALSWASRLNQVVAYDAQYLALAEMTGSEFWTADKRLAQGAQFVGATWVSWLGSVTPQSVPHPETKQ